MAVNRLAVGWRERAAALERFSPIAANAFRDAADELEAALRTEAAAQVTVVESAKEFVLAQVSASPRELSTSDLRRRARGHDLSHETLGRALRELHAAGAINFERGRRGARLWYCVALASLRLADVGGRDESPRIHPLEASA